MDGAISELVKQFVDHLATLPLKSTTIREREHYLSSFLFHLKDNGINSVDKVDRLVIMDYLRTLDIRYCTVAHMILRAM